MDERLLVRREGADGALNCGVVVKAIEIREKQVVGVGGDELGERFGFVALQGSQPGAKIGLNGSEALAKVRWSARASFGRHGNRLLGKGGQI